MTRTLLVTVDSLRYDHFRHFPATRDYLEYEHDRAFSTFPETFGSFPAIIGGEYATERGLPDGTSVARRLDGHKVGLTTNHLLSPRYGYDDAFDHFESPSASEEGIAGFVSDKLELGSTPYKIAAAVWNQFERARAKVVALDKSFRRADDVIETFFEEIDGHDDWFGWLHFMEPHHPYDPHSAPVSRDYANRISRKAISHRVNDDEAGLVRELYRRECEELDVELRRLWEGIPDDTEIVFLSDHGELLGEDDVWGHPGLLHPLLHHVPLATRNVDWDFGDVASLIDVPSMLIGEEHGLGKADRDVAFALYGDRRAAMNRDGIVTHDPDADGGAQYTARDLQGNDTEIDDDLKEALGAFDIDGGITRYDADEETLAELGYLE